MVKKEKKPSNTTIYIAEGLEWRKTAENAREHSKIEAFDVTEKDLLAFRIKEPEVFVEITPKQSKVMVYWDNYRDLKIVESVLREMVVCKNLKHEKDIPRTMAAAAEGIKEHLKPEQIEYSEPTAKYEETRKATLEEINLGALKNPDTRLHALKDLYVLCQEKRVAHIQSLYEFIDMALNDKSDEIREITVNILNMIIFKERKWKPARNPVLKRVIDKYTEPVKNLALSDPAIKVQNEAIYLLGAMGDKRAIDPIFYLIRKLDDTKYANLEDGIENAFTARYRGMRTNCLLNYFKSELMNRLYQLAASQDPTDKLRAKSLLDKIRSRT